VKVDGSKVRIALIAVIIGVLLGAYIGYALTPTTTFTISPGVYPGAPDYTIWKEGSNYFAKNKYGEIEFSGTDASTVIQSAIDALTSGRTWKEKVVLRGQFTLNKQSGERYCILVPSYTILEIHGRLSLADNQNATIIEVESYAKYWEIIGGILHGNKNNNPDNGVDGEQCGIFLGTGQQYFTIKNVKVLSTSREGFYLHGSWGHIEDIYAVECGQSGIALDANNYVSVVNPRALNNELHGIYIIGGASLLENTVSIFGGSCYGNEGYGIKIINAIGTKVFGTEVRHNGEGGTYEHNVFISGCRGVELHGIHSTEAARHGIYIYESNNTQIIGGTVTKNSQYGGNEYAIRIYNSNYTILDGVNLFDYQETQTQKGILEDGNSDYNIILGVNTYNCVTIGISVSGANTHVNHCWNLTSWIS